MSHQELRTALRALPFRPFTVQMADGRAFEVRHPDYLIVGPTSRTAFIYSQSGDEVSMVDVMLMTELQFARQEVPPGAGESVTQL